MMFKEGIKKQILSYLISRYTPFARTPISNKDVGITSLLCHSDVYAYISCIYSLFYQLKKNYPLYVVDDGSLTQEDKSILKYHFTIIIDSNTDVRMQKMLSTYKYFYKYRFDKNSERLNKKFDAFLLNPFKRFVYLDSDILFFSFPKELQTFLRSHDPHVYFTARDAHAIETYPRLYSQEVVVRKLLFKYFRQTINSYFNSGLLCVPNKTLFNISRLNNIFKLFYEIKYAPGGQNEESAVSLLINPKQSIELPHEIYPSVTFPEEYHSINAHKTSMIHYSGIFGMDGYFFRDAIFLSLVTKGFKTKTYTQTSINLLKKIRDAIKVYKKIIPL